MAAYSDNLQWFYDMSPLAIKASAATGVFPSVILAQWALETGYGASELAKQGNNYGGIKYVKQSQANGAYDGQHAGYDSVDRFVEDYTRVLNLNYLAHVRAAGSPERAIQAFTESNNGLKYAEDPNYSTKLQSIYTSYGLAGFDTYTPPASGPNPVGVISEKVNNMGQSDLVKYATIGLAAVLLMGLAKGN
jgi:flagellum-specific peptidoglycan hydrolase FlgJ